MGWTEKALRALEDQPRTARGLARCLAGEAGGEAAVYPLLRSLVTDGAMVVDRAGALPRYALDGAVPREAVGENRPGPIALASGLLALLWVLEGLWFLTSHPGPLVSDAASYWLAVARQVQTGALGTYWPPLYPAVAALFHLVGGVGLLVTLQTVGVGATALGVTGWLRRRRGELAAAIFLGAMALDRSCI